METFCEKKSAKNLQGKNYRGVQQPPIGCIRANEQIGITVYFLIKRASWVFWLYVLNKTTSSMGLSLLSIVSVQMYFPASLSVTFLITRSHAPVRGSNDTLCRPPVSYGLWSHGCTYIYENCFGNLRFHSTLPPVGAEQLSLATPPTRVTTLENTERIMMKMNKIKNKVDKCY